MEQPTRSQINCSICNQPVALEIAKTDDSGQALHEECYVLKLGAEPSRAFVQHAEQTQNLNGPHRLSDKTRFVENSLPLNATKVTDSSSYRISAVGIG